MTEYWVIESLLPFKHSVWMREFGHKVYESWQIAYQAVEQKGVCEYDGKVTQYRLRKLEPTDTVISVNEVNLKTTFKIFPSENKTL